MPLGASKAALFGVAGADTGYTIEILVIAGGGERNTAAEAALEEWFITPLMQ